MDYRHYAEADLPGVLELCAMEGWPSLPEDPGRAHRALTAPGVTTVVATEDGAPVGFAQLLSDGQIQAYLALISVHPEHRRKGVARKLIVTALRLAGGLRVDLLTDTADGFYRSLPHLRMSGYRLYPEYSGPDRYDPSLSWDRGRKVPNPG
ncbi:MAG TPA: GNAT family N-acetyltransferase [Phenylobacterium sp.]|uniref:GNAT family N-acetyltransferase n=1 Tax=Phenylobacterium sp. TaxID=1871053 RepID=UPI002F937E1E